MKLARLLDAIADYTFDGDTKIDVKGLAYDSRKVQKGDLFVAIKGHIQNGHEYFPEAIRNGAIALLAEGFKVSYGDISRVTVPDSRRALSKLAARFYGNPCDGMDIIGITGTNGKTTTSYILESIISSSGRESGVIGTINSRFQGITIPSAVTTPESLDLMRIMKKMLDHGVTHVVLEVSSHALDQGRTDDCPFSVVVFTNFSRDHLDYHNTMEGYFNAKSRLFKELRAGAGRKGIAVINGDDPKGEELASLVCTEVMTYGLDRKYDVTADRISTDRKGLKAKLATPMGEIEIRSSLIGKINIYNILAATAAALALGFDLDAIGNGIASLKKVPGRMELVENARGLTVVVDYAHTPDALLKIQETLRPLTRGRLITVFGCGGNRDRGKRFEMGLVAGENSDIVFITSDNPRNEDPESIVMQAQVGVEKSGLAELKWPKDSMGEGPGYFIEVDRREAIKKAVSIANTNDIILIAGKGHEDYQIVGSERRFFDDRKEVALAAA